MVNTEIRLIIFFAAKDGEALYSQQKRPGADCGSDHELLIAKFRLKLKKVGKTTRPFRYDLLELTPKKHVLFIIGEWNAKVGSQETPGVTGKFGLKIRNEAGQRLIEFCQENALVIANTLF